MGEHVTPRLMSQSLLSDLVAMAAMVFSLPRIGTDAIYVLPGQGEEWRVVEAVARWQGDDRTRHLLVAGSNPDESTFQPLTLERLSQQPYNLRKIEGVISAIHASNTAVQAQWLADKVDLHGITSVSLLASSYHLLRAYCTMVMAVYYKRGLKVPILPVPSFVSPAVISPENHVPMWDLVPGEVYRIGKYQRQDDVTTYDQLRRYIEWLWKQLPQLMAEQR